MFQGTLAMLDDAPLVLTNAYEYQNYVDAFGSEELALKKAIQALFNNLTKANMTHSIWVENLSRSVRLWTCMLQLPIETIICNVE